MFENLSYDELKRRANERLSDRVVAKLEALRASLATRRVSPGEMVNKLLQQRTVGLGVSYDFCRRNNSLCMGSRHLSLSRAGSSAGSTSQAQLARFQEGTGVRVSARGTNLEGSRRCIL